MAGLKYKVTFGSGSETGPWLEWHAQASRDGKIPALCWTLRYASGASVVTEAPRHGFVLHI